MRSDTTPAGSRDLPAIWGQTRDRIIEIVGRLPNDAGAIAITTVPGATLRDAIGHLVDTATNAADLPAQEIHERDPRIPDHMRDREFVL
jgi:hypothetical protein